MYGAQSHSGPKSGSDTSCKRARSLTSATPFTQQLVPSNLLRILDAKPLLQHRRQQVLCHCCIGREVSNAPYLHGHALKVIANPGYCLTLADCRELGDQICISKPISKLYRLIARIPGMKDESVDAPPFSACNRRNSFCSIISPECIPMSRRWPE